MDLLFVIGPPAVGKMTVGKEIADRTGLRLFHNHMMIEPVLHFFDYEDPAFGRLVEEFRTRVFEEVAASDLPGLIFTYVWAFDEPADSKVFASECGQRRPGGELRRRQGPADRLCPDPIGYLLGGVGG